MTVRREWVEIERDGQGWKFDLTFLTSGWECIYGRGCKDLSGSGTARGCCLHGVEVYDDGSRDGWGLEEFEHVRERVAAMTDEDWQNRQVALRRGGEDPWGKVRFKGGIHTRLLKGACIFHNRPDHPAGPGCAFHVAALRRGESPLDWKPRTCWMAPLYLERDDETKTTTVRPSLTEDWGVGAAGVDWWCTEKPAAFHGERPVYVTMEQELRRICGDAVYDELRAYIEARHGKAPVPLPMLPMVT